MCSTVLCLRNIRGILKRKVAHITFLPISVPSLHYKIQIQVKHRRKYKSQDHQAGRWQHSCAWQRIIQPWALITAHCWCHFSGIVYSRRAIMEIISIFTEKELWIRSAGAVSLELFTLGDHREHCRQGCVFICSW